MRSSSRATPSSIILETGRSASWSAHRRTLAEHDPAGDVVGIISHHESSSPAARRATPCRGPAIAVQTEHRNSLPEGFRRGGAL
jgi:hypothetical protein